MADIFKKIKEPQLSFSEFQFGLFSSNGLVTLTSGWAGSQCIAERRIPAKFTLKKNSA